MAMWVGWFDKPTIALSATSSSVPVTGQRMRNMRKACARSLRRTSGRTDHNRAFSATLSRMPGTDRPLVVSVVCADQLIGSFGLGVCNEVFGYDRRHMGLPRFDFGLVAEVPGIVRTDTGLSVLAEHDFDRLDRSDILLITAWELFDQAPSEALLDALRRAHARGATLISHCTGVFVLATAGLLDGLRVTTHWKWSGELAARFPELDVAPAVLYVDNGSIITGAGTAAGVDTLLHLVRREWGAAAPTRPPGERVAPPHRDGGQAQFIDAPVPACQDDLLGAVLDWATAHLAEDITVELLARRALM